ncbi:MAG: hypothetical protein ACOX8S_09125 [Christensenellales bacterium]|jgi:hypothetical protein
MKKKKEKKRKKDSDQRTGKGRVIIISALAALVLITLGIFAVEYIRSRAGDEIGEHDGPERDAVLSIEALSAMKDAYDVQKYAAKYLNVDAEAFLFYVFGMAEDVYIYEESYDGEVITEITRTWASEGDYSRYLFHLEFGELYFERGDIEEAGRPGVRADRAESLIREVLQLHGLRDNNLIFQEDGGKLFPGERDDVFYFSLEPVDGLKVSLSNLGISAIVSAGDVLAMSYLNLEGELRPIGEAVRTLSAWEAAQSLLELEQEDINFYGDLIFKRAELVYEAFRVVGDAEKAVLAPVWELYTDDNGYFQLDAVTGEIISGMEEHAYNINEWMGE